MTTRHPLDAAGSQTTVTDSSGNSLWSGSYAYGVGPFLTSETDMDRGAWTYTVDALGERTGWRDPKSQSFSETYDALARPLTRGEPDLFTQWTWGSSAANHNVGRLQSVCTGTGSSPTACNSSGYAESETYDALARLGQRSITIPSVGTFSYGWSYNANTGLLDTLTYPVSTSSKSLTLQYAYQNGILLSITDTLDSPNVTVWQANATNAANQITQETLGNGLVTTRNYDAVTQWLGSVQSGVGGGAGILNLSVLYDLVGNVTQRQDNNHSLTESLYYDNVYRLSSSKLNGTQNLSIGYDLTGNITQRSDVANNATWTYDSTRKHAVTQAGSSSFSYAYDPNGNMMTRQGATVGWSSYNYPTSISAGSGSTAESVTLAYGPDRQRWQQVYSGNGTTETTDYVGELLQVVTSGSLTDYRHYIYAGNTPVAVYSRKSTGTNTWSYLLSDHLGSVATVTNSSGASVVAESFTPSGARRNPTTWSGAATNTDLTTSAGITRQGFTFQTSLGLWMGLNHMNGRVEDAIIGRFLSADPHSPHPGNTQTFNRYSYVLNNPLTYLDPSGFDPCDSQDNGSNNSTSTGGDSSGGDSSGGDSSGGDSGGGASGGGDSGGGDSGGGASGGTDVGIKSVPRPTIHEGCVVIHNPPEQQVTPQKPEVPGGQTSGDAGGSNGGSGGGDRNGKPQGNLPISPDQVTVTGTRQPQSPQVAQFEGLPPGIEIIIEGTRVQRGSPTYTPEQPVPPVPRAPVQSPVNPSTTPPPGQPGWLWWQMFQLFFRGLFNGSPSVVPPTPTAPPDCSQQLCA